MSAVLQQAWTRESFLEWAARQEGRYEFDGTGPVAMTGGTVRHSMIMQNVLLALAIHLRGTGARALGPDVAVMTKAGTVRFPDILVTTEPLDEAALTVIAPLALFEIASPSSRRNDSIIKVQEYAGIASVRQYTVIEQASVAVTVFERNRPEEAWRASTRADVAENIVIPQLGVAIPLGEIYARVTFGATDQTDSATR